MNCNKTPRKFLWDTIYKKLVSNGVHPYDIDVRYLDKFIRLYNDIFPKFIRERNYTLYYNPLEYRYEFYKGDFYPS
jgi:hypothetical protein